MESGLTGVTAQEQADFSGHTPSCRGWMQIGAEMEVSWPELLPISLTLPSRAS